MPEFYPQGTPMPVHYYRDKYRVSNPTLWRYRKAGLPALKVGGKVFIKESDFIAFLERMNGKTMTATPDKTHPQEEKTSE